MHGAPSGLAAYLSSVSRINEYIYIYLTSRVTVQNIAKPRKGPQRPDNSKGNARVI
jgi:hypothetical protein